MNIVVISRSTNAHFISGGMETQLKNLLEGLVDLGHKVFVITTSYPLDGEIFKENKLEKINGVEYFYIGDTTSGLLPLSFIEFPWKLLGILDRGNKKEGSKNFFEESLKVFNEQNAKKKFDIIISQSTGAYGIAGKTNLPIVSISHGTITNEIKNRLKTLRTLKNWFRFLLIDLPKSELELLMSNRKFYEQASSIACVSNILKSQFLEEYSGDQKKRISKKTTVIYNGVDSDKFSPSKEINDKFKVLYVGRVDREKGIDLIIRAMSELKSRKLDISADIIGGGIEEADLKNLATSLDVSDRVKFLGQVQNDKLTKYYNEASLFVFPSRRLEGQPMTVVESFCSGLPVIATRSGGLSEIIEDGVNGVFVESENYIDIADKVEALFVNKKRLIEMSKNARISGLEKFSKVSMVKSYEKLLESLSNGKGN
ncbi:hypothetical protein CO058_02300 [candidate division WWE3 bacterium CG_4_9_14_0_2_um_filter_35_11]|uniref:Uncharacterized protein n=1 Tax=candidate division WWE3 bacterium CG_4_9_14_0_2_um_filter_35_11 TaxID=1975077 RepID=A0A2M8ELR3_UNCKA|nr:MAG: hypothetical protein COV25_00420 [candidate division WWE3 bacterium CG10_big_fil_rev_8_21_14_0_10_35_32]PJC23679.1 MAG: hypothetical protein CO058_02300 [candidate division WWE3 bacterium CG_4_9_14_0_2_um_filter_35_11]